MAELTDRIIVPIDASHPELGRWLWALEDTRARTKEALVGLGQESLDWTAPGVENSIGSLLYHIALIEGAYLYGDILGMVEYPAWLDEPEAFAIPDRDDAGRLSVVSGVSLDAHLARLDRIRVELLRLVAPLTAEQLATPRYFAEENYDVSPAWVLHHLMQHEAEHRGQIAAIRALHDSSLS
ncbi:MAG TPA: DinB family protein [Thermomicrobiales bacterium]|nr:DinB family protein [Thermomicrobiales bacterium]